MSVPPGSSTRTVRRRAPDVPHGSNAEPRASTPRFRFTIGQLMVVVLVSGLAMAPVAMYRQQARIELIVATVGFETIGLPTLTTLLLLANMEPGRARTRMIMLLCLTPVLLILAAF